MAKFFQHLKRPKVLFGVLMFLLIFSLVVGGGSVFLYKNHYLNFLRPYYYDVLPSDSPLLNAVEDNLALYYEATAIEPELAVNNTNKSGFLEWQVKARSKLKGLLGVKNNGVFNEDSMKIVSQEKIDDDVLRLSITYSSYDNVTIPCYLFVHDEDGDGVDERPGILIVSGHGNIDMTAGLLDFDNKYFSTKYDKGYQNANAEYLAKQGYVTLTCENRGFGKLSRVEHETIAANAFAEGRSYQGILVDDHMSEISLLQSLDQVDKDQIGVAGVSLGGEQAFYIGAVDERVKAVVSMGWLSSYEVMLYPNYCTCWSVPGLLKYFDQVGVGALTAPRAALYSNGELERGQGNFNSIQGTETTDRIRESYGLFDKDADVKYVEHEGDHTFDNKLALEWFKKHLG